MDYEKSMKEIKCANNTELEKNGNLSKGNTEANGVTGNHFLASALWKDPSVKGL